MTQTVHRLEARARDETRWQSTHQEFSRESDGLSVLAESREGRGVCGAIVIPALYSPTTHEFRLRPIEKKQSDER